MIFPKFSKEIGIADEMPYGEKVYFRTRYLIRHTEKGYQIYSVELDHKNSVMHEKESMTLIADTEDCTVHEETVNLYDSTNLIKIALKSGKRCTIFRGADNHVTFIMDPSEDSLLKVYVYDVTPPYANIYENIRLLEKDGVFGELGVEFVNCVLDISKLRTDVYPCRASGFKKTVDKSHLTGTETVAGCETSRLLLSEMYGDAAEFKYRNICPAERALSENRGVFIAKCCQEYRFGLKSTDNVTGYILGWGASPKTIIDAVFEVCRVYREKEERKKNAGNNDE